MPTLPMRLTCLAFTLLLISGTGITASPEEPPLYLDRQLQPADSEAPLPLIRYDLFEEESPLTFSQAIPLAEPDAIAADSPARRQPLLPHLDSALTAIWLLTALLLGLHLVREWVRVMRVRVRRPPRSIAMQHAPWPTISILIPAHGDAATQSRRLDSLQSQFFDYPVERIHFVPMFDPADAEVINAVARLTQAFPAHVHPLPMMSGRNTTLASALNAAVTTSIGTALIVLDREGPLPQAWLRQSVTPLLDPAIGAVLSRAIPAHTESALSARLSLLGDHADTLIATQSDALSLLLCGKARIRALRRQAVKSLDAPDLQQAPDGAGIVLGLTRMGWQSRLLGEIVQYAQEDSPDVIRSPRMRISIAWQSMRMVSLLLNPLIPRGARLQGGAAFFSAALPLIWLASLLCGIALYFADAPLRAGLAIALCTATSFDPHGHPSPAFSMAAAARMAGLRTEIRLLPLSCFAFIDRLADGLQLLLRAHREPPAPVTAAAPGQPEKAAA